jgi:hypothetical protein
LNDKHTSDFEPIACCLPVPPLERFEKLDPFPNLGLRRNFFKGVKRSAAAEQPLTGSRNLGEFLEGSGFIPEPPYGPESIWSPTRWISFLWIR